MLNVRVYSLFNFLNSVLFVSKRDCVVFVMLVRAVVLPRQIPSCVCPKVSYCDVEQETAFKETVRLSVDKK